MMHNKTINDHLKYPGFDLQSLDHAYRSQIQKDKQMRSHTSLNTPSPNNNLNLPSNMPTNLVGSSGLVSSTTSAKDHHNNLMQQNFSSQNLLNHNMAKHN